MSNEQRTRVEIVKAIALCLESLQLLLQEQEHLANEDAPRVDAEAPLKAIEKPKRAKKEKPELPIPTVGEKMADIVPTKPAKTLADLMAALQECINKHGMPEAKARLAPYLKVSMVPDDEIAATIARLAGE